MKALGRTVLPLFLILASPILVVLLWYACVAWDGSFLRLASGGALARLIHDWPWPTWATVKIVGSFAAFEALLLLVLPGRRVHGPVTPAGDRPLYRSNALVAWALTHVAFYLGAYRLHWFSPAIVYDHFGSIIMTCSLFALLACALLYWKGVYFPSGRDAGLSGNPIFDFFWGVELHPRIGDFDMKQFANCRVGMMGWSLIVFSFLAKQQELYHHVSSSMLVVVGLQAIYVAKFFWWETGYFWSLDIMHDRFGFYICWGVWTWLPVVYTSQALYLVRHPIELPLAYALFLVAFGLVAIYINYDADAQRQRVRKTQGQTTVWGKRPELIVAEYRSPDGARKESLLLASGWWGLSRHFHYLPEIAVAISWSAPCQSGNLLPWFYPIYLTILLVHRAFRDDRKCRTKYGAYWSEYCARVPYRIIPGLF